MCFLCYFFIFFFKQKTAYEMRISDWSSDVCSSDLQFLGSRQRDDIIGESMISLGMARAQPLDHRRVDRPVDLAQQLIGEQPAAHPDLAMDAPEDRKSTRLNSSH